MFSSFSSYHNSVHFIIECSLDGKADYIVTGDPDLLELKEFNSVKILNVDHLPKSD